MAVAVVISAIWWFFFEKKVIPNYSFSEYILNIERIINVCFGISFCTVLDYFFKCFVLEEVTICQVLESGFKQRRLKTPTTTIIGRWFNLVGVAAAAVWMRIGMTNDDMAEALTMYIITTIICVWFKFNLFSIVGYFFKWDRYKKDGKFLFCLWESEEIDPQTKLEMENEQLKNEIMKLKVAKNLKEAKI